MEKVELSKRLEKVAGFVKEDEVVLDIGSDHAYLPIYLIEKGKIPAAIAGEVALGPYERAKMEAARYQLTDRITIRLANGFDAIKADEKVGTIFICGMGGRLISNILEAGLKDDKLNPSARLVLQANNNESELRELLVRMNYQIIDEAIVKENEKFYEIIAAEKSEDEVNYTIEELTFGPDLMRNQSEVFREKWQAIYRHNHRIINQLDQQTHAEKRKKLKEINKEIEKVVK